MIGLLSINLQALPPHVSSKNAAPSGWLSATNVQGIRPKLVHRIDKDTSGLLLVARHDGAARMLTQQFKAQEISKSYLAVVKVTLGAAGIINAPLLKKGVQDKQRMVVDKNGQDSQTAFTGLDKTSGDICLVAMKPITGQNPSIAGAQRDYIGCPILGDGKYERRQRPFCQ